MATPAELPHDLEVSYILQSTSGTPAPGGLSESIDTFLQKCLEGGATAPQIADVRRRLLELSCDLLDKSLAANEVITSLESAVFAQADGWGVKNGPCDALMLSFESAAESIRKTASIRAEKHIADLRRSVCVALLIDPTRCHDIAEECTRLFEAGKKPVLDFNAKEPDEERQRIVGSRLYAARTLGKHLQEAQTDLQRHVVLTDLWRLAEAESANPEWAAMRSLLGQA